MKQAGHAFRLAAMSLLVTTPSLAAPFCIRSQVLPPQCLYYDAQQCNKEAARQGAVCSANPAELRLTPGFGRYCVVTSQQVSICQYTDRNICQKEASAHQGTCTEAPAGTGRGAPDPYSPTEGN